MQICHKNISQANKRCGCRGPPEVLPPATASHAMLCRPAAPAAAAAFTNPAYNLTATRGPHRLPPRQPRHLQPRYMLGRELTSCRCFMSCAMLASSCRRARRTATFCSSAEPMASCTCKQGGCMIRKDEWQLDSHSVLDRFAGGHSC